MFAVFWNVNIVNMSIIHNDVLRVETQWIINLFFLRRVINLILKKNRNRNSQPQGKKIWNQYFMSACL